MTHTKLILTKFIAITVVMLIILPFVTRTTLPYTLITAAILTAVSYALGDLLIFPRTGNIISSVTDAILAALIIWMLQYLLPGMYVPITGALIAGLIIGMVEFIFHRYMADNVMQNNY